MIHGLTNIGFASSLSGSHVGAVAETPAASGIYIATLTSTKAGAADVTVQQGGTAITGVAKQTVTFTHKVGAPDKAKSTLGVTPATFAGDGTTKGKISFVAKDATGAAVTGLTTVTFTKTGAGAATATIGAVTESSTTPGTYEAELSGMAAGLVTVGVKVGATDVTGLTADATLS